MRDFVNLIRRFGVLPLSQGVVLAMSTLTFAWLARQLGPEHYARFAVILLAFSATSLITDLSPQGYVLVHGMKSGAIKAARHAAVISAVSGSALLCIILIAAKSTIPGASPGMLEISLLCLTLAAQSFTQVPRARLVISGRYKSMATTDIIGTALGCAAAIVLAQTNYNAFALVLQLSLTVFIKLVVTHALSRDHVSGPGPQAPGACKNSQRRNLIEAVTFGVRVIPLNLASYLSRALDSGLLPSLVSATAAAGYARSYQLVVVPISQLQLSLGSVIVEKFSRAKRDGGDGSTAASLKLWVWLQRLSILSGIAVILGSSIIQHLLFGPRWPLVNVTLSAMATCLPGVAAAAFGAWSTQIEGGKIRTLCHFLSVLITPLTVVITAASVNFTAALGSLVIAGGVIQPILLALVHRQSIPLSMFRIVLVQFLQWSVVAILFLYTATVSGFWETNL